MSTDFYICDSEGMAIVLEDLRTGRTRPMTVKELDELVDGIVEERKHRERTKAGGAGE